MAHFLNLINYTGRLKNKKRRKPLGDRNFQRLPFLYTTEGIKSHFLLFSHFSLCIHFYIKRLKGNLLLEFSFKILIKIWSE